MHPISFCHIAPIKHILHAAAFSTHHMALQHLCHISEYVNAFRTLSREKGNYIYLDNSQYELGHSCSLDELIIAGHAIGADCLILPDGDLSGLQIVKREGFDVMYIPSAIDLEKDMADALHNPGIDVVGLSYSKTAKHLGRPRHSATSRFDFLQSLGMLLPNKKIHMLGISDTVHEIALMKPYTFAIRSWDSSNAVWAGLNGRRTSKMLHKFGKEVDFLSEAEWNELCSQNIEYTTALLNL